VRRKLISLIVCIAVIAAAVLTAGALGFKIVYAPWLENKWGAIDAVGTWVGALLTTILTAIIIRQTKKTSEQAINSQNEIEKSAQEFEKMLAENAVETQLKIAETERENAEINRRIDLFEQRYDIYSTVNSLVNNGDLSVDCNKFFTETGTFNTEYYSFWILRLFPFGETTPNLTTPDNKVYLAKAVLTTLDSLGKTEFFFNNAIWERVLHLKNLWYDIIAGICLFENYPTYILDRYDFEKYIAACKAFNEDGVLSKMKDLIVIPENTQ